MAEYSYTGEKLITEEGKVALKNHKYKGADPSLLYIHFLGPIAQFWVDNLIPEWLA